MAEITMRQGKQADSVGPEAKSKNRSRFVPETALWG